MASKTKPLFAFFGTPRFATTVLNALERRGLLPALVVTAPDKPRGRGLKVSPSPAKAWALERGIDVAEPATLRDGAFAAELQNTDWDLFVVAAYAKLIPENILTLPRTGCLNVHPSLLPKFRGASPVQSAILADEREGGVSIMQMTETMDAGPIVAQARIEITPEDWPLKGSVLLELLATEGGNLLAEVLPEWIRGSIVPEPQDDARATYTRKFTDADARLDLSGDPRKNLLSIRAFDSKDLDSSLRAYYLDRDKRVIVTEATIKDGKLIIERVIPEGKKEMAYEDYLRGRA
jgi:methionyl-tRNA formyltransferase